MPPFEVRYLTFAPTREIAKPYKVFEALRKTGGSALKINILEKSLLGILLFAAFLVAAAARATTELSLV